MKTARGYLQCKTENNDNADSSRLFSMLNWKESGVNNDNGESSRLFTMPN